MTAVADAPGPRQGVRRAGTIGSAPRRVAGRLAAHGAGAPPQYPRYRPQRTTVGQSQAQGFTDFNTQVRIAFLWHGNTYADQGL